MNDHEDVILEQWVWSWPIGRYFDHRGEGVGWACDQAAKKDGDDMKNRQCAGDIFWEAILH